MMAQYCKLFDCRYRLGLWNALRLLTEVAVVTFDDGTPQIP